MSNRKKRQRVVMIYTNVFDFSATAARTGTLFFLWTKRTKETTKTAKPAAIASVHKSNPSSTTSSSRDALVASFAIERTAGAEKLLKGTRVSMQNGFAGLRS
jgi:hypothetical protein